MENFTQTHLDLTKNITKCNFATKFHILVKKRISGGFF